MLKSENFTVKPYDLNVKLFLDLYKIKNTVHSTTATVFDPFESYFNHAMNNSVLCFINIYFDLIEIERRNLELEIQKSNKSIKEIEKLYEQSLSKINHLKHQYYNEVVYGNNENNMRKWNDYVMKNIGIDNN